MLTTLSTNKTRIKTSWPLEDTYEAFFQPDILPQVQAVLKHYQRWTL